MSFGSIQNRHSLRVHVLITSNFIGKTGTFHRSTLIPPPESQPSTTPLLATSSSDTPPHNPQHNRFPTASSVLPLLPIGHIPYSDMSGLPTRSHTSEKPHTARNISVQSLAQTFIASLFPSQLPAKPRHSKPSGLVSDTFHPSHKNTGQSPQPCPSCNARIDNLPSSIASLSAGRFPWPLSHSLLSSEHQQQCYQHSRNDKQHLTCTHQSSRVSAVTSTP